MENLHSMMPAFAAPYVEAVEDSVKQFLTAQFTGIELVTYSVSVYVVVFQIILPFIWFLRYSGFLERFQSWESRKVLEAQAKRRLAIRDAELAKLRKEMWRR